MIVIDSGVWISALEFGGTPLAAVNLVATHDRIAICKEILTEITAALTEKFGWSLEDVESAIEEYVAGASIVQINKSVLGVCRDPADDMIIECALAADASHILSGDKDLLSLGSYHGVQIVTARQYIDQY